MSVLMSKEEIALTINRMKDDNDNNLRDGYDRVIERMCNYVEANIDDFMECYEVADVDCELHDTDSISDIMGGGQG